MKICKKCKKNKHDKRDIKFHYEIKHLDESHKAWLCDTCASREGHRQYREMLQRALRPNNQQ